MIRTRRVLGIALAVVVFGVVLIAAGALLVLQTEWGRNRIRIIAERQASQALGAQVTMSRLQGSFIYGATADELSITDEGQDIITVGQAAATYDLFDLIRGTFALDEIILDRPVIHAQSLALLGREADEPATANPVLSIGTIVIRDGQVLVGSEPADVGGFEVPDVIRDLNAVLSVDMQPQTMTVAIDRLSFVGEAPSVTLKQLSGTVMVDAGDLVLENINVQLAQSSMDLNGTISNFRNLRGTDGARVGMDDGSSGPAVVARRP
ncbi:MAG: hypothetical protein AB7F99_00960 [Vicinamibacterales bacterium]